MLALDIGIKHLAFCVADLDAAKKVVVKHWSVVNLTNLADTPKPVCYICQKPAKAKAPEGIVCGRHIPKDKPQIFDEETGKPIKKMPTIAQMTAFCTARGLDAKGKRPELLARVEANATLPLTRQQKAASFAENTCGLHDSIREWIKRDWAHISEVRHIYIEHQPVYKNPVMKTVQILIFATMRDAFLANNKSPAFHFVHAGKKVKGAAAGDEGYKDRKLGSNERVRKYLEPFAASTDNGRWYQWWLTQTKKDDASDTLCMILDSCVQT
jgi:hypothetical protein